MELRTWPDGGSISLVVKRPGSQEHYAEAECGKIGIHFRRVRSMPR
jgi:hypothetical protein